MNRLKTYRSLSILAFLLFLIFTVSCKHESNSLQDFEQIESVFRNIPDSIQTSVYWYWVSDNISKEGVVKDLQAMKKVGINRAFIGNIGLNEGYSRIPYGKVKFFTDEWWDILHTALKTATELNIEIGIFNSPGWSQSGGPWIKPEQSMRYLNSSEIIVTGPKQFNGKLTAPNSDFQRVNVIAYKAPVDFGQTLRALNPKITSESGVAGINNIMDGDKTTQVKVQRNQSFTVNFLTEEPVTVRSLIIQTAETPIKAKGELLVKEYNEFKKIKDFVIDRSKPDLSVGFNPYAPVVISVPEIRSNLFRLVISESDPAGAISEIELSASPVIERYPEKSLAKMFQTPLPYWHDYMWPDQPEVDKSLVIEPQQVVDISKYMTADGTLNWTVPEGKWVIMQNGMTSTGMLNGSSTAEGTGLEVDKMSKELIEFNFDAFLGEIIRRVPAEDRKTWKVVVADSYECGSQNWTDGFIQDFKSRYRYDPVPYMPVFKGYVVGSREVSDRFLWDMRRMVADKIAWDYLAGLREISHKHGLTTWLENYGHWGFPGEFLQYGGQSDAVAGEFWSEGDLGNIENRAASSCAHIYGKKIVSSESFTSGGVAFSRYPAKMKKRGDRFFTEGVNNTLLHVYIQQPDETLPGVNAWFGNEFNRNNTWFSQLDLFIKYLKRTNFMLQQGTYVADAAYFIGEDVPKMTGVCDPPLPRGYSFDYINSEVLQQRASVKDGKITLPDGMSYRILVLPKLVTMRPEMLLRIKELVEQGAVVLGPAPKRSPGLENYPESDQQVQKMTAELWGKIDGVNIKSARVGKGTILSGMDMQEALDMIKVLPDFRLTEGDTALFIHRNLGNADMYYVSNQFENQINISPEFRVSGLSPELWDPITGSVRDLPGYIQNANTTIVPLKLEAFESQFIIFRKKTGKASASDLADNFPEKEVLKELNGPWNVTFNSAGRGPVKPVVFKTLMDWTKIDNDSIRYYSGTAFYKITFNMDQIDPGRNYFVDLGLVKAMAKVNLNGKYAGGVWTAPWTADITDKIGIGENTLEVEVVNTWVNRLIGDSRLPAAERKTWCSVNPFKPDSRLDSSGLIGPVRVVAVRY